MKYNDFAALTEAVKQMSDVEKQGLTVREDEGIVRVDNAEGDQIFQADAINFVHAFFILLGVAPDDTISINLEEPTCLCGDTVSWLVRFFGPDYLNSHIQVCSECGQAMLHVSDESAKCLNADCGYTSGGDAEGNHYVRGKIVSNGGRSIDELRDAYFAREGLS